MKNHIDTNQQYVSYDVGVESNTIYVSVLFFCRQHLSCIWYIIGIHTLSMWNKFEYMDNVMKIGVNHKT